MANSIPGEGILNVSLNSHLHLNGLVVSLIGHSNKHYYGLLRRIENKANLGARSTLDQLLLGFSLKRGEKKIESAIIPLELDDHGNTRSMHLP